MSYPLFHGCGWYAGVVEEGDSSSTEAMKAEAVALPSLVSSLSFALVGGGISEK